MSTRFAPNWEPLPASFWSEIFGNNDPVAVEIGPGRGEFLEAVSIEQPDWNFFAIEQDAARANLVRKRIEGKNLTNARIVRSSAEYVLSLLPEACVDAYHIQFPDPWWKRRHHRRRLMKAELVTELHRTLRSGAGIHFLTDVEEYFHLATELLAANPGLEEIATKPEVLTTTSFARKAGEHGWQIHAATFRKK